MENFDGRRSKAFDVVLDTVKLFITLSTAIIGFIVSAILMPKSRDGLFEAMKRNEGSVKITLILLGGCVLFCILCILKISGVLGNEKLVKSENVGIYDKGTRILFLFCLIFFLAAICVLARMSFCELNYQPEPLNF